MFVGKASLLVLFFFFVSGVDIPIAGDELPPPDAFAPPGATGVLPDADLASLRDDELRAEQAEKRALQMLRDKRHRCGDDSECVERYRHEEEKLRARQQHREHMVRDVLRKPRHWVDTIELRTPRHPCDFPSVNGLLRHDLPRLGQRARRLWRRMRKWEHALARISGTLDDFNAGIRIIERVERGVLAVQAQAEPLSGMPGVVGRHMQELLHKGVEPLLEGLEGAVPQLKRLRRQVRDERHSLRSMRRSLRSVRQALRHVAGAAFGGTTALAMLKTQLQSRHCRGERRAEAHAQHLSGLVEGATLVLKEVLHSRWKPHRLARYSLTRVRDALLRVEQPVGHAQRTLIRFQHALHARMPLRLPMLSYEDVELPFPLHRKLHVPHRAMQDVYLSPNRIFAEPDRFGKLGPELEDLALKPMRPLLRIIEHAIQRPFARMSRLLSDNLERILHFGDKVLHFSRRGARVEQLLHRLDLPELEKELNNMPSA